MDEQKASQQSQVPLPGATVQPGQAISPILPEPVQADHEASLPPVLPTPPEASEASSPSQSSSDMPAARQNDAAPDPTVPQTNEEPLIQWQASEFASHDKSIGWYAGLFVVALLIAAVVYLLTKDKISAGVVVIAAIALAAYAGRKPRQLTYALFEHDLTIGQKVFNYNQFRSFSLDDEGSLASVSLVPHRRFGQLVTLYFDPRDEQLITDFISTRLPLEKRSQDLIDGLLKKIHF